MPMPTASEFLRYANLQMAAEALYGFDANVQGASLTPGAKTDGALTASNLTTGNRHASKFASGELQTLTTDWVVVQHISNTATGFSGTLFFNVDSGECVLSFRSTEFIDDAARDNEATNVLEIKDTGWAFGQISDMEAWYQSLVSNNLITGPLTVTGYSLGGHLATAFNLMHGAAVQQVITFNGAGVGKIGDGTLATTQQQLPQMIAWFSALRAQGDTAAGLEDQLQSTEGKAAYRSVEDALAETGKVPDASMLALIQGLQTGEGTVQADYELLSNALNRALAVTAEAHRVPSLTSGSTEVPPNPANIPDLGPDKKLAIAADFGSDAQALHPFSGLQDGFVKLA